MIIQQIRHVYDNFELDVKKVSLEGNKIIGLIGENGSGKTISMASLAGFLRVNHTFDVLNYAVEDIMYVPSDLGLYEMMTVNAFVRTVTEKSTKN